MNERTCNWCGQLFSTPSTVRVYCSTDCSNAARWIKVPRNNTTWCPEWSDAVPSRYGPVCIPCKLDSGHDGAHTFEAQPVVDPHLASSR